MFQKSRAINAQSASSYLMCLLNALRRSCSHDVSFPVHDITWQRAVSDFQRKRSWRNCSFVWLLISFYHLKVCSSYHIHISKNCQRQTLFSDERNGRLSEDMVRHYHPYRLHPRPRLNSTTNHHRCVHSLYRRMLFCEHISAAASGNRLVVSAVIGFF